MNCGICSQYLALQYDLKSIGIRMPYCAGCRPRDKNCAFLKRGCDLLSNSRMKYCYECSGFPCQRLKHLDERYRRYHQMSMIENLEYIKNKGIQQLLEREKERWKCSDCGGVISCHNGICFDCGLRKLRKKEKLYRW